MSERLGDESETSFTNYYIHCGVEWQDEWSCMCDDRCPVCNCEIEPYKSEDDEGDFAIHVNAARWIPEGGWPDADGPEGRTINF